MASFFLRMPMPGKENGNQGFNIRDAHVPMKTNEVNLSYHIVLWPAETKRNQKRFDGNQFCCMGITKLINSLVLRWRALFVSMFFTSSSKDMFVKFWDLDTQHCFLTLVGHKSEVYSCMFFQFLVISRSWSMFQYVIFHQYYKPCKHFSSVK